MKTLQTFLVACLATAGSAHADTLILKAEAEPVPVSPGNGERRQVRLPDLALTATITTECNDNESPAVLTLSAADTRERFELNGHAAPFQTTLNIPAKQLPPLSSKGFCVAGLGVDQPQSLLKRAMISVHASLRCATPAGESLTSASRAVDVLIECQLEASDGAQDSSASSTSAKNTSVASHAPSASSAL